MSGTSTQDLWAQFPRDPRQPEYSALRASDSDRDVVLRALGEAFAEGRLDRDELDERSTAVHGARTLGELPEQLADLVPVSEPTPTGPSTTPPLVPEAVEAQAVARWERSRREALSTWICVSLACWVIWLLVNNNAHPWPVYPMLGTAMPLIGTMVKRKDMIEANRRRIEQKHEKQVARAASSRGVERQKLRELEG